MNSARGAGKKKKKKPLKRRCSVSAVPKRKSEAIQIKILASLWAFGPQN